MAGVNKVPPFALLGLERDTFNPGRPKERILSRAISIPRVGFSHLVMSLLAVHRHNSYGNDSSTLAAILKSRNEL